MLNNLGKSHTEKANKFNTNKQQFTAKKDNKNPADNNNVTTLDRLQSGD